MTGLSETAREMPTDLYFGSDESRNDRIAQGLLYNGVGRVFGGVACDRREEMELL
jgi:hypothetical protein